MISNSAPRYILKQNENINLKRYMHPNIYCSTIYNSQDMEAITATFLYGYAFHS